MICLDTFLFYAIFNRFTAELRQGLSLLPLGGIEISIV